jgi:hypothetical protein
MAQSVTQSVIDRQSGVSTQIGPAFGLMPFGQVKTGGVDFGLQVGAEVVKSRPYEAQAVTEMKQTLADGSHIVQTNTATVARDSEGRTVRIQKLSSIGPWKSSSDSSQADGPTLTSVFDPVTKTHINYSTDNKVAHEMTIPNLPAGAVMTTGFAVSAAGPGSPGAGVGGMMWSVQGKTASAQPAGGMEAKTESLGAKTIEGVPADGTRVTSTIPKGAIGNDSDIVITRETWYSADLQLVLQSSQDDPRFGQTTYSLSNIQRNEPDGSLFQVPAGYRIEKAPSPLKLPPQ